MKIWAVLSAIVFGGACSPAVHRPALESPPVEVPPLHDTIGEFRHDDAIPATGSALRGDTCHDDRISCREVTIGRTGNVRIVCELYCVSDTVLEKLEALDRPRVDVDMIGVPTQEDFSTITRVPWLTSIGISKGHKVTSLEPLRSMKQLRGVVVDYARVSDLSPLEGHDKLVVVRFDHTDVADVQVLSRLPNLESIFLDYTRLTDLEPLTRLKKLDDLSIVSSKVRNISPIARMTTLRFLNIARLGITDIKPLASLRNLRMLNMAKNPVADLSPVAGTPHLGSIDLADTNVTDLRPLSTLQDLTQVIASNTSISDVNPLATPPRLQWIEVDSCRSVASIAPLARSASLRTLNIAGTSVRSLDPLLKLTLYQVTASVSQAELARFKSRRPDVDVHE